MRITGRPKKLVTRQAGSAMGILTVQNSDGLRDIFCDAALTCRQLEALGARRMEFRLDDHGRLASLKPARA